MLLRTVSSSICPRIWPASLISLRILSTASQRPKTPPVSEVKDGSILIEGYGTLDTECRMAKGDENLDECNICHTCVSGQSILEFTPSRQSYAAGLYSDLEMYACESCVLSLFQAVREANKKCNITRLEKDC